MRSSQGPRIRNRLSAGLPTTVRMELRVSTSGDFCFTYLFLVSAEPSKLQKHSRRTENKRDSREYGQL